MKRLSLISLTFAAGLVLAVSLAACGGNDAVPVGEVPSGTSPDPAGTDTTPTTEPTGTGNEIPEEPRSEISYRIWLVQGEGESLTSVQRTGEATRAVGASSLTSLLAGPTELEQESGVFTAIPDGTRLLGLVVSNGIATVDLSSEFESGGGSLSMMARLGQVACTLDQFPTVNGVQFELDGEPVDVFSGEGIILDKPVKCADYEELLPVIVVESPAPGAEIQSGVKVTGSANVFEANVSYFVIADEVVYARGFTTATCGTGCRGRFSFRLRFQVDEPIDATLVVHDDDAAGVGQPPHSVRIPVRLMPS
jgi:spore germination protein GerM